MAVYADRDPASDLFRLQGDNEHLCGLANEFLDANAARGLTAATIRAYAFDLVSLFRWLEDEFGGCFEEILEPDLLDFIKDQQRVKAQPSSINRRLTTCQLFYRFVVGKELEGGRGVTAPGPHYKGPGRDRDLGLHWRRKPRRRKLRVKTPRKLIEPLNRDQVVCFVETLRRFRDLAIVSLMLFCGLRSKEVLDLRLGDINVLEGRFRIHGKGNIERVLPLPSNLMKAIADYTRLERPRCCQHDRLFVVLQGRRRGQPMTAAGLRSIFRHRRSQIELLANANAHRFRHTFGADMARAGVRLSTLQRMMGHADAKTTLRYVNLSMSDVADEFLRAVQVVRRRYEDA